MFFQTVESVLWTGSPALKTQRFQQEYPLLKKLLETPDHNSPIKPLTEPSYQGFCKVVSPKKVMKRGNLESPEGRIAFLHALAHIEYSAIDLALDAVYRFRHLPVTYYEDWLEVAADEVRHFLLLTELLKHYGLSYGDLPVHSSLFEAAVKTPDLLSRMAVIPRYFEANGLDATDRMMHKIRDHYLDESWAPDILSTLDLISTEEISHVSKGSFWFRHACRQEGKEESVYFEIIQRLFPKNNLGHKTDITRKARLQAGFTQEELNLIEHGSPQDRTFSSASTGINEFS
ncbi:MAG: ferritin-like domain-containing protein [SAR324 cluster bacterium]|nr:ferritin-like domain-containing protein [SAR324 cluster bacterium]